MAGPRGTKVIPNGTPGHSDVKWGLTEKIVTASILALLTWAVGTIHTIDGKVDVLIRVQNDHVQDGEKHETLREKTVREERIAEDAATGAILRHIVEQHLTLPEKEDE